MTDLEQAACEVEAQLLLGGEWEDETVLADAGLQPDYWLWVNGDIRGHISTGPVGGEQLPYIAAVHLATWLEIGTFATLTDAKHAVTCEVARLNGLL